MPLLSSAAPTGRGADPILGLARYVMRDAVDLDVDLPGVGPFPDPQDDWDFEALVNVRFDAWLRRRPFALGPTSTTVGHASDFGTFLYESLLTVHSCTEYDFRLYLYEEWPRALRGRRKTVADVLEALGRFFEFVEDYEDVGYPWAPAILNDVGAFEQRCDSYPAAATYDDPRLIAWRRELYEDLDARVLLPSRASADGGEWLRPGVVPVTEEEEDQWSLSRLLAALDELSRRWLVWREEVIAGGTTDPEEARGMLVWRQWGWERQPHAGLGGETPAQAVRRAGIAVRAVRGDGG